MREEIIENNVLIAKFLGGSIELWEANDRLGDDIENDAYYVYFPECAEGIPLEYLDYHEDWNCLMEVVEKIENYNECTSVIFAPQGCAINCYMKNGFSFSNDCDTKIEAVYNACTKFIKWVNNESK